MRHEHFYVVIEFVSRYNVGWMIAHRKSAELAEQIIADTIDRQQIVPRTLTVAPACARSRSPNCSSSRA